jgi:NAD(P)-dependent dehydrogenase (short-subunit alcohol dehydrogenase family)
MMQHGAKNIILLSRSAGKPGATASIAEQAEQAGCRIKGISCDVANSADLNAALQACKDEGFPPVRGIVQGAMVLKVSHSSSSQLLVPSS